MIAALLTLALNAAAPKIVKPVSMHALSAGVANYVAGTLTFDLEVANGGRCQIEVVPIAKVPGVPVADPPEVRLHLASMQRPCAGHVRWVQSYLRPGFPYAYTVVGSGLYATGTFWTPPKPGSTEPFTFAVVGDSRDHEKWAEVARAVAEKRPRFVLTTGDSIQGGSSREAWRDYYLAAQGLFASTPVFAVRGNHDLGDLYAEYNPAPSTGIGPSTYAFQYGNAGFLALDSNAPDDPRQLAFAKKALSSMRGGPLFVFQHHPLYSCGSHGSSARMQQAFGALFEQAHVTYDFAGHDHDLIDWKPVGGVHYAVSGGGGAVLYPLEGCSGAVFAKESYGFALVTVHGPRVQVVFYDPHGIELYRAPELTAERASIPAVDLAALARP